MEVDDDVPKCLDYEGESCGTHIGRYLPISGAMLEPASGSNNGSQGSKIPKILRTSLMVPYCDCSYANGNDNNSVCA